MPDEPKIKEGEVVETSSTEVTEVKEGGTEETVTPAAEEKTPEEKEEEAKAAAADKEKRFSNEDMKKLRQSLQHETRKERDARIAAETEARVLRELAVGKKPDATAEPPKPEIVLPPRPKRPIAPQEDAFQTREEYDQAVTQYNEKTLPEYEDSLFVWKGEVDQKRTEVSQKQDAEKKAITETSKSLQEMAERGKKKYEDFDEVVVNKKELSHNVNVQSMIFNRHRENLEDIAYFLEKNPAEASRLNAITDSVDLAIELRSIAAKFKAAPAAQTKTITKAPAPAATVQAKTKTGNDTELAGKSQADRVALIEKAAIERRKRGG